MPHLRIFLCLLFLICFSPEANAQRDQSIPLTITSNTGAVTVLTIRFCDVALDQVSVLDTCDVIMPPRPPVSVFDVRLKNPDVPSDFEAKTDARPLPQSSGSAYDFDVEYQVGSSATNQVSSLTIGWNQEDIESIPEISSIELTDNVSESLLGPFDMTTVSSIVLSDADPSWALTGLRIKINFQLPSFILDLKAILSGAYNDGEMRTELAGRDVLESTIRNHPYSSAPWNYTGLEEVNQGFFSSNGDAVDWIYIQLLSGDPMNPPMIIEAEKTAILMKDGQVINHLDGSTDLGFFIPQANYYILVDHRNHLSILSATPVDFVTGSASFDFSSGPNQVYSFGAPGQHELTPGVYGMLGGDGNASGDVSAFDYLIAWLPDNGSGTGYWSGDFNMDSSVSAFDLLNVWLPFNGRQAQVP